MKAVAFHPEARVELAAVATRSITSCVPVSTLEKLRR